MISIGDTFYLADYNGVKCTTTFNYFVGCYYVDDIYDLRKDSEL